DLSGVAAGIQKEFPDFYPKSDRIGVVVQPLREELTGAAKPTMFVLLVAAGFVLLIACASVANLNLARMVRRDRELAVRAAIGAGRSRLFRQLLTESFLLSMIGGGLRGLLAGGGVGLLTPCAAPFSPPARDVACGPAAVP